MKRLPKENEYQLDIKDQFKNEFEIGQLQGNNFHMTDSADLPMLIEPQGNIEQEVIEAVEGIVVEGSSISVNDVDTSYEDSIMPKGNIEQVVVEEIPGNTIEGEIINITNGDSTKEVKAIVNGNSYQETIAEEVGTTVVNKSIHLTDVNTAKESKLAPNGGIEQDSREGYNKLNIEEYSDTGSLITSISAEKIVATSKLSSTANYEQVFYFNNIPLKTGITYTLREIMKILSGTPVSGTGQVELYNGSTWIKVIVSGSKTEVDRKITFTVDEDTTYRIRIKIAGSKDVTEVFSVEFSNLMIYEGTEDKPYEQYGQMPSLDFPSEVKGVSGHYDTVVENKNRFDGELEKGHINKGKNETNDNLYRSKNYQRIKPNTNYAFGINGKLNRVVVSMYDKEKKYIGLDDVGLLVTTGLFATYENAEYIRFRSYADDKTLFETGEIQLEKNTVATPFTPHREQNLPIDIPFNMYSGKPYKENGKWYRPIEYLKVILDGTETIRVQGAGTENWFYNMSFKNNADKFPNGVQNGVENSIFSNMYKKATVSTSSTEKGICIFTTEVRIREEVEDTADNFKARLAELYANGTPLYVVYKLETPTIEEITDTTLIAQLEALQNAELYEGVTNINTYSSSEYVADLPIEAHYNFITPSPSVERPSDIEVIESVNKIDVVNGILNGTMVGVSCSVDKENQTITVNGKRNDGSTGNSIQLIRNIPVTNLTSGDTYRLTLYGVSGSYTGRFGISFVNDTTGLTYIETWGTQTTTTKVLEFSKEVTSARLFFNGDFNANNYTFKIMVSKGTDVKPYLPYGCIGLLQRNKNIWNNDLIISQGNSSASILVEKDYIRVNSHGTWGNGWVVIKNPKKNTLMSVGALFEEKTGLSSKKISVYNSDGTLINASETKEFGIGSQQFDVEFNTGEYESLMIRFWGNYTATTLETGSSIYVRNIQLKYGGIEEYEAPKSNLIPIDLQGNTLAKVGDIKDLLNIGLDGSVSIEKKTIEDILNGVTKLFVSKGGSTNNNVFLTNAFNTKIKAPSTNSTVEKHLSNYFKGDYSTNYLYGNNLQGSSIRSDKIFVIAFGLESEINTVELANAFLKEHNVEVIAPLEKSETINLPSIKPIKLFEGTNNFELVTNLDTTINMTYNHVGYSPSIVKPSEVKGVGSEEDISLVDLSKPSGISSYTSYSFEDDTLTIKSTGAKYQNVNYDITDIYKNNTGKILKFQKEKVSQTNTTGFFAQLVIRDVNGTDTYASLGSNVVTHTIPTDISNISNVALYVYASTTETVENTVSLTKPMLYFYKGVDKPYTPYGYCKYDTLVENKNLYDYNNAAVVTQGVTVDNEGWITMSFDNTSGTSTKFLNYFSKRMKSIKNSTKYNIVTEIKNVNGTGSLVVSSYDNGVGQLPWTGWDLPNLKNNTVLVNERTSLANQDQSQVGLRSYLHIKAGQSGSVTFRVSVVEDLEVTAENFKYTPHQEQNYSIDIPTGQVWYSGKPYKVNGKWYKTIEYGKDYIEPKFLVGNPTYRFIYTDTKFAKYDTANIGYSNIGNLIGSGTGEVEVPNIWLQPENNRINIIWNSKDAPNPEALNTKIQALIDNGTQPYFVAKLATPIREEITDPVLISQLEALEKSELYEGVTNINSYKSSEDVADLPIEAHYNFITPSPSIDRPSEVLEVGSEEDINLYNIGDVEETTKNGVTYSIKNGKFKANGKATASFSIITSSVRFDLKNGNYSFGVKNIKGTYSGTVGKYVTKPGGTTVIDGDLIHKTVRKTLTEDYTNIYASIYINSNAVFDNYEADLLLVNGTYTAETLPPFTPYGYCRYETKIENKNFINLKNLATGGVGIKVDEENYIYSTSPTADSREYKYRNSNLKLTLPSGTYTLSAIFKTQCTNQYGGISIMNSSDEFITSASIANKNSVTKSFTLSKEMDIGILTKVFDGYMKLQVEKGDTATEIVEHQEQNLPIDLPIGMKMYNDEFFYKENGKWYRPIGWVEKIITSEYLNNLVQFNLQSINSYGIANFLLINSYTDELYTDKNFMYSNYFKNQTSTIANEKENGILAQPKNEYIRISSKIASTTDEFKKWVDELNASGKPLKIYRELAKPYPEEITDANLIAQLEKTLTPFSYYPVTNINSYKPTENVADFKLYAEYFKSNKITNK